MLNYKRMHVIYVLEIKILYVRNWLKINITRCNVSVFCGRTRDLKELSLFLPLRLRRKIHPPTASRYFSPPSCSHLRAELTDGL